MMKLFLYFEWIQYQFNMCMFAAKFAHASIKLSSYWMFCWQSLPRCRTFALCPFDFYSGDALVRGEIQQTAKQRDRWKARLLPLYEGLSPILSLWQELIRVWGERQRGPLTHTYAHIIHSKRDINPSFRAGDSAKGNGFLLHTSQTDRHLLQHLLCKGLTWLQHFKGRFDRLFNFISLSDFPLGYCYRRLCVSACSKVLLCLNDIGATHSNHKSKCSIVSHVPHICIVKVRKKVTRGLN